MLRIAAVVGGGLLAAYGIRAAIRAVSLAPDNPGFGFYLGLAYLEARQDVEAASELWRVVAMTPEDIEARVNLAWAQINVGKSIDAAASLTDEETAVAEEARRMATP